ncbi:hypothetical protein D9M69_193480 [compost metagenome]
MLQDCGAAGLSTSAPAAGAAIASRMKSRQICAGKAPPVTPFIGVSSSLPTHTPATSGSVKPTNQASRLFWLVPVLPAANAPGAAPRPVPRSTTNCKRPTRSGW